MAHMKGELVAVSTYIPKEMHQDMKKLKKKRFPSAHKHWASAMLKDALALYIGTHLKK